MSAPDRVELTVEDSVAHLRLVRAEALNAIDPEMVDALGKAVDACAEDERVRVLLISAAGRAFTVGGDLRHFESELDRLPEELEAMVGPFHAALGRLGEMPVPIVCAAQGGVGGGGLGLLWCADVVLASDDLKLATGFARLALSGDGGSSWWLPRLVGMARARELLLRGRVLSAAEAADWGLVSRVVPDQELQSEALATARELAAGPTLAYGEMRRLLARSGSLTLAEGLAAERTAMVRCGASADAREGVTAFVERREPRFGGR